jgi:hypothetical protein
MMKQRDEEQLKQLVEHLKQHFGGDRRAAAA